LQINRNNLNAGKAASEPLPVKTASAKTASVKSSVTMKAGARSVSSLVKTLGLPSDKLSASVVSFARFFSLPLKPQMLAEIRRQAFSQPQTDVKQVIEENSSPNQTAKNREALSLAAAAAESKGVELRPDELGSYAEAVDPDWEKRRNSNEQKRGQRGKEKEPEDKNTLFKTGVTSASGLEKTALESAEKNPLLCVLNRLPGKNGQRWIVLPFEFSHDGRDFRVSIRILLETQEAANRAVLMALDLVESGEDGKSWLFALEAAGDKAAKLSVFVKPELPQKVQASLKNELSLILGIPVERIFVKSRIDDFPCESGLSDDLFRSIDEAV